jgi:hypothetical protein
VALAGRHRFLALGERMLRGKGKPTPLYTFASDADGALTTTTMAHGAQ